MNYYGEVEWRDFKIDAADVENAFPDGDTGKVWRKAKALGIEFHIVMGSTWNRLEPGFYHLRIISSCPPIPEAFCRRVEQHKARLIQLIRNRETLEAALFHIGTHWSPDIIKDCYADLYQECYRLLHFQLLDINQ